MFYEKFHFSDSEVVSEEDNLDNQFIKSEKEKFEKKKVTKIIRKARKNWNSIADMILNKSFKNTNEMIFCLKYGLYPIHKSVNKLDQRQEFSPEDQQVGSQDNEVDNRQRPSRPKARFNVFEPINLLNNT